MAIQYRTSHETGFSGGTPRTVSTTGVVSGDLVLLALCFANAISSYTPPSGFTLVASSSVTDTPSIYIYAKIAGGSEPGTYSLSWTGGGEGEIGLLSLYSDLGLTLAVNVAAAQHNASGDRLWPSIVTTVSNAFLACFATLLTNTATTPHAGMTERLDLANGLRVYLMTATVVAAGATGTRTGTGTASVSSAVSVAVGEPVIFGTAAIQLDALTLAATGVVHVRAGADITLDALTLVAMGKVAVKGAAAITLAPLTMVATGQGPPFVPTSFTATAISASRIDLSWEDTGPNITGYEVERSLNGTTGWALIGTTPDTIYTDDGLAQNTHYYYRVRAYRS